MRELTGPSGKGSASCLLYRHPLGLRCWQPWWPLSDCEVAKQRDGLGPPPDFPCLLERLSHPSALLTLPWLPPALRIKSKRRPLGPSPTWSPDPFLPSFRPATPALFCVALQRKVHSSLRTFALANSSVWEVLHPNCQWLALASQASAQRFPPQRQVPCPPASPHALFNLFRAQSTAIALFIYGAPAC